MDSNSELMKFIGECISIRINTEKIGNLRCNSAHYALVPNVDKYDNLTISQYIIYYKIYKLEELQIITTNIRNELIALYDKYLEINMIIGSQAYKEMSIDGYKSDNMSDLYSIRCEIKEKLLQYNLDDDCFNLKQMIDEQIVVDYKSNKKKELKIENKECTF